MTTPIASTGSEPIRLPGTRHAASSDALPVGTSSGAPVVGAGRPAARLAALGPPIDMNRVSEIRAAIAQGTYTVDADRLAAAMLALDLPVRAA